MRFLGLTVLAITLFFGSAGVSAAPETVAKQAIIVDTQTGQVLFKKNSDLRMPTSSMSKVMTVYMVFDAIKNGQIKMDSTFPVSTKAYEKGGSKMFVKEGSKIKVEDLLRGVIIQSGNDATIVLAEGLAGSEEKFAEKMTAKAKELGMENSNFMNASGWPDPKHYSTAEDLTILANRMMKDFPEYYKLYGEKEFTYSNITQKNRNPLLYKNIGADGLKTGHTEVGGYGLIGTSIKNGRRVLMVLNGMASEKDRADESERLIEWAQNNFVNKTIYKAGAVVTEAPVSMGKEKLVSLTVSKDLLVTLPKTLDAKDVVEINYKKPVMAPIEAGDVLGELTIQGANSTSQSYELVAAGDVEKLGFFGSIIAKAKTLILGGGSL